jgi:hypothetical protein
MLPQLAFLAVAAFGIDAGWEPLDGGGVVYIIQIEPDQLDRLKSYDDLLSDMPKDLDVRQVKITIGTGKLPRSSPKLTSENPALEKPTLIAEGSIPARKSGEGKVSVADDAAGPQLTAPTGTPADKSLAKSEASKPAEATPEKTTTLRPIDDGYSSRDPKPRDEEELNTAPTRIEPAARAPRDELFATPPSRPLSSRQLEEPREIPQPSRLRERSTSLPADRYVREPDEDYEAAKPTLPSSFRTADNSTRLDSVSDDRNARGSDAAWGPVVAIFFFLLLSMGANMWLAWIAWEARQRYQVLLDKYRSIGGKPAMELA